MIFPKKLTHYATHQLKCIEENKNGRNQTRPFTL
jgi:hypothetical protein